MENRIRINGADVILEQKDQPRNDGSVVTVLEGKFTSKVHKVSEKVLQNSNGTHFRIARISFTDATDKPFACDAIMWETNYQEGLDPIAKDKDGNPLTDKDGNPLMKSEQEMFILGEDYLTTVTFSPDQNGPGLTVSTLRGAVRSTNDTFGFAGFEPQPETADESGELVEDLDDLVG
jgi:hypothetical protein